jgi:carboxyl-terminal processing protease
MKVTQSLHSRARHMTLAVVILIVFAAGFALGNQQAVIAAQSQFTPPPGTDELFAPFWQVYNLIQEEYVDPVGNPVDNSKLVDGAITGMVDSLGDEFSGYMDATAYPMINQELEGKVEGIGVVIRTLEDTNEIEVVSVMKDSPASTAGIQAGDIFAKVDGEDVSEMTQTEMATRVRGPEGTPVTITMKRGDELIDFNLTRASIIVPMVESRVLDDNIGYLRLNQFGPDARADIDKALTDMHASELNGLVFDLRGNPGGLLTTAIDVGSAFIQDGPILVEDFGSGNEQVYNANGNFSGLTIPIAVLVDESSASASELIAGALQDTHRATIIGETTFGKGTVQTWQQLVNGGGIRLTIARWLTPDRHWIHKQGIVPDIEVDWDPTSADDENDIQLNAAVDFLESQISAVQQ